jgi:hypothetical protein
MKLYTEEQILNSMQSVRYYVNHYNANVIDRIINNHVKSLKPIELPSEEEIDDKIEYSSYSLEYGTGFKFGIEWVINCIKQQEQWKNIE